MTLSEELTGRPPCVTFEKIQLWRKLADDIEAAMMMGGDQGYDLLVSMMPDWCEAADDVNSAVQICLDMARQGLRDEAREWHAEGFFEVADRLIPERPGWEEWQLTLGDDNVMLPRLDSALKQLVDRMLFDELEIRDLSGQSVDDYIRSLRKNILERGHLGERLVILESLRALDPGSDVWAAMIEPIKAQRAGEIESDMARAVQARDEAALGRLRAEANALAAGGGLPERLLMVVRAVDAWRFLSENRRPLADLAATVVGKCDQVRKVAAMTPAWLTLVAEAFPIQERMIQALRNYGEAIKNAGVVSAIDNAIGELGFKQAFKQLSATVQPEITFLDDAGRSSLAFESLRGLADECVRHAASAPTADAGWEGFKEKRVKWSRIAKQREWDLAKQLDELPIEPPPFATAAISRLQSAAAKVDEIHRGIKTKEVLILVGVFGGIAVLVGIFVVVLVIGSL